MGILRPIGNVLTSPAEQLVDPAEGGTARLLAGCLLAISFVFACLDTSLWLTRVDYMPPWEGYILLATSYGLSRTRFYRLGALLATLMFPLVATAEAVLSEQHNSGALAYAVLAPLFAGLFLRGWICAVFALLVPLCIILIPILSSGALSYAEVRDAFVANVMGGILAVAYAVRRDQIELRAQENSRTHEAQMLHMQKMEALGRLAGGIAHDFNNLLTVISGGVELLARHGSAKELKLIDSATTSAQALTSQLLTLSRQGVVDRSSTDLSKVLHSLHELLSRIIGEDIQIRAVCADDVYPVALGGNQLQQVLLNLATNARDAMPRGGLLEFSAKNSGPDHVVLSVTDSGEGMDELTVQKVFEPFFTTKAVGKGTGLGMSMVFGLITQAGGTISIDSKPKKGTTFHVRLRRAEIVAEAPPLSERRLELKGSAKGCVLLVEDDSGVRSLCRSVLRRAGYEVLEAADPMEAIELFDQRGTSIDLVLSDIVMPQMTGLELGDILARKSPGLPVLFMSGYAPEDVVSQPVDSRRLLRKPFRPTELLRRVSAMLYGLESQAPPAPLAGSSALASVPMATQPSPAFPEFDTSPDADSSFESSCFEVSPSFEMSPSFEVSPSREAASSPLASGLPESQPLESEPAESGQRGSDSGRREAKTGKRTRADDAPLTEVSQFKGGSKD